MPKTFEPGMTELPGPPENCDILQDAKSPRSEPPEDNWDHQSGTWICGTCMWYKPKGSFRTGETLSLGRCKRHAPTLGGFPAVYSCDTACGDHKLDERKVGEPEDFPKMRFTPTCIPE